MPPSAISKLPCLLRNRAGEGALLVAEQLAFDQRLGERGAVDGDEGAGRARAAAHGWRGHELLARAALAQQEHGNIGSGHTPDHLHDLFERGAGAHDTGGEACAVQAFDEQGFFGVQAVDFADGLDAPSRRVWR